MATAAMLAPVGCSIGADEEPKPATGAPAALAATVERLERAIAEHDFAAVCDDILTASARKRSGGDECEAQLASAAGDIRRPAIQLRAINVRGDRATVEVSTAATGQARVRDELQLKRETGGWRVEALR